MTRSPLSDLGGLGGLVHLVHLSAVVGRAAGMQVSRWLLLQRVNQGQAAGQKLSSAAPAPGPPRKAAGWLADLMLGTRGSSLAE